MSHVESGVSTSDTPQYIRGVPHPLPAGERLLWEGAPQMRLLATHVFHWRVIATYFAIMLGWWLASTPEPVGGDVWVSSLFVRVSLSAFVLGLAFGLAKAVASTTWYAITSQRVVLRIGMVFSVSINVPFKLLASAGVGRFKDGSGQVTLVVAKGHRIAYSVLWPHCRVFRLNQPEPVLRGLPNAEEVGRILADAVVASSANDAASRVERGGESSRVVDRHAVPQPAGA
jgi:hypothetical protein